MTPEVRRAFDLLPDRIKRFARPSLRIGTSPSAVDTLKLGQSRIGGVPDLPREFSWPHYKGLQLSFISQINLLELTVHSPVLPLPKQGSLAFFYDSEQRTWGFDPKDRGGSLVAYFPGPASSLIRTPIPEDVSEAGRFPCCSVEYYPEETLPDPWSLYYDPALSEDEKTRLYNFQDAGHDSSTGMLPKKWSRCYESL